MRDRLRPNDREVQTLRAVAARGPQFTDLLASSITQRPQKQDAPVFCVRDLQLLTSELTG